MPYNFNPGYQVNIDPRNVSQADVLRGSAPTTQVPTRTPISSMEASILRQQNEAQARSQAEQQVQGMYRGSGILGAPLAAWLQKRYRDKNIDSLTEQNLAGLEQAMQLENMRSDREFNDDMQGTLFEQTLANEFDVQNREDEQLFDQSMQESDQLFRQSLADQEREQELADRQAEWDREDAQLAAEIERADEAERRELERAQDILNDERARGQLAEQDSEMDALLTRYNELADAFPVLAQMAGVEEDMGNLSSAYPGEQAWGAFKRITGGTGPLARWLPSTRMATQRVEQLSQSEALNKMSSLDTPLTPVSDRDIELVMGTSISPSRTEQFNYDTAKRAMEYLEAEMRMRVERMNQTAGGNGRRIPGVGTMEIIE